MMVMVDRAEGDVVAAASSGPVATMLIAFIVIVGKVAQRLFSNLIVTWPGLTVSNKDLPMQGTGVLDSAVPGSPLHMTPGV